MMLRPFYYDFHIHSALSPCADDDMTPNDIVSMAQLCGLDMIAVTDHNTFANVEPVIKAAEEKGVTVIPGAEIETREEVHVICLFPSLRAALGFEAELSPLFSAEKNRADIFGQQLLYDEHDRVYGEIDRMLMAPADISFDALHSLVGKYGGSFIPAHIDRGSYSVLSNLGSLPPDLPLPALEVSLHGLETGFVKRNANSFPKSMFIFSSDAHHLWDIAEKNHFLLLPENSPQAAISALNLEPRALALRWPLRRGGVL